MSGDYNQRLRTFDKLKKTFEHLVAENLKLQDKRARVINPYEQKLSELTKQNGQLKDLIALRERWDKENLPDDEQEFIRQFMDKYDPQDKASLGQG